MGTPENPINDGEGCGGLMRRAWHTRPMYRNVLWLCLLTLAVSACGTVDSPKSSPQTSSTVPTTVSTTAPSTSTTARETTTTIAHSTTTTQAPPASLSVLVEPAAGYGFVTSAINGAARSVTLTMYELEDPAVMSALEQARHRGVAVSVVLDANLERSAILPPTTNWLPMACRCTGEPPAPRSTRRRCASTGIPAT